MSTTVTYKGSAVTTVDDETKVLLTGGKYLEDDITLTDVASGGGLAYEEGTYTATEDGNPTIYFSDQHSNPPIFILFVDVTGTTPNVTYSGYVSAFSSINRLVNSVSGIPYGSSGQKCQCMYGTVYRAAYASLSSGAYATLSEHAYVHYNYFIPYFGNAAWTCRSGRTYKWIAVWID